LDCVKDSLPSADEPSAPASSPVAACGLGIAAKPDGSGVLGTGCGLADVVQGNDVGWFLNTGVTSTTSVPVLFLL